jgi:hypothetical protein
MPDQGKHKMISQCTTHVCHSLILLSCRTCRSERQTWITKSVSEFDLGSLYRCYLAPVGLADETLLT